MQTSATTLEKIWRLLINLNIDLPNDPVIPLLGIYPEECNTVSSKGIYTPIFIAAYSQYPRYGNSQNALLLMNGSRCSTYT
jgi:hypothetical protein